MSKTATNGKRLLRVTAGNLRNSHLSVRDHLDFFPPDCLEPARKPTNGNSHTIELQLVGLKEIVTAWR